MRSVIRMILVAAACLLAGCAANQLPGYQNTYYSYAVPDAQMDKISRAFRQNGLLNARVMRDSVGRIRLAGSYKNEDDVDAAFIIVQSIVGIKSTSPFYPEQIEVKRWEIEAGQALAAQIQTEKRLAAAKPQKRALIIGINDFKDSYHIHPIPGEDDAKVVQAAAVKAGYTVNALLGKHATRAAILAALEQMERDVGPNDSLFIYISSHGLPPLPTPEGGDTRKMSIVAYDTGDASIPDKTTYLVNASRTSVPDTLVQRLASKPTRNTRILIDTCYSGEMLQGIPDENADFIRQANGGKPESAGISMASWTGDKFTSKGIRFTDDRSKPAANKGPARDWSDRSHPYTIFTATGENQESLAPPAGKGTFENPVGKGDLKGSFFTQAFFAYLEQHDGQMELAFEDARRFTANKARSLGKEQLPRIFSTVPVEQNNLYQ
jgi:hypothetical protein